MSKKINLNRSLVLLSFQLSMLFVFLILIRAFTQFNVLWVWLIWNLFLAWVGLILIYFTPQKYNLITYPIYLLALLFFPNILYLITDLIHIRLVIFRTYSNFTLDIFDTALLLLLATIGIVMHLVAFNKHQSFWLNKFKEHQTYINPVLIGLVSYGLYLGRILRLNSWDFYHPKLLLSKTLNSFVDYRMYLFVAGAMIFNHLLLKYYEHRLKKYSH